MRRFSNLFVLLMGISAGAFGSTGDAHGSAGVTFVGGCGLILATMAHHSWKSRKTK